MVKKPPACSACPLYKIGQGFVPHILPANYDGIKLLVQGEAPGRDEIDEGKPFVGKSGHWLRNNILANAGVASHEIIIANTLCCLPPINRKGEHYPTGKVRVDAERACRQYDIWDKCPATLPLMLFGNKALELRLGHDSISDWHGSVTLAEGRVTSCTFHPAAVMRQPNLLPVVIREITNLLEANAEYWSKQ